MVPAPNFFAINFFKFLIPKLLFPEFFHFGLKWKKHGAEGEGRGFRLKLLIQIVDPNPRRKLGNTQILNPNGAPEWWTQMCTQMWDPNSYEGNVVIFDDLHGTLSKALEILSGIFFGSIWVTIWSTFGSMPL